MTTSESVLTDPGLAHVLDRCLEALSTHPSALLTDIDGTISPMAPTPDAAVVDPGAIDALDRISRRLDMTGVVTGRALDVADRLIGLPDLVYVGNHGLERRIRGSSWDHPDALVAREGLRDALTEVGTVAASLGVESGLILEDKRLSGTVHYRQAPDTERVAALLGPLVTQIAEKNGLRVTEGRMIWELRPTARITKGTAVADLIDQFHLRGVVFFGDDTTDVDAFRVIRQRRERGDIAGLRVGVIGPESPQIVADESDVTVPDVGAVVTVLTALAVALDGNDSG